ncbi:hypothetical protein DV737_g2994, partial [Chaetothyriales sp. CBS 132003]
MPSSPSRAQHGRTLPKRAPLGEITASAANEISARVARAEPWSPPPKVDADRNVFVLSPFPEKPAQVLLPSTVRKQKSLQNISSAAQSPLEPERRPQVRLKRSVKTLRDLYEAQAEESSRPGTAISVDNRSSRPGTAGSRLRSQSSSDGLSGKYAWEHFKSLAAADEFALLPSLPETGSNLRHTGPSSSFALRAKCPPTSSPNYRLYSPTLSPKLPIFRDLAELPSGEASDVLTQNSTAFDDVDEIDSSPNVVRLGPSSSMAQLPTLSELESISDYEALGTTMVSPEDTVKIVPPSSSLGRMTSSSSSSSRKRKRADDDKDSSSAANHRSPRQFKTGLPQKVPDDLPEPLSSSPPRSRSADLPEPLSSTPHLERSAPLEPLSSSDPVAMQSSPPEEQRTSSPVDDSSPVLRVLHPATSSPEQQSVAKTHASLQVALFTGPALSSSPEPSDKHPVVRAPLLAQMAGLMVPKRRVRSLKSTDALEARWPVRLSADTSLRLSRTASPASVILDEEDAVGLEYVQDSDVMNDPTNNSQVRIIPDSERHEGSTASRGFGFPFNRKANQWSPPSIGGTSTKTPGSPLYRAQIACYLTGFVFPISWFIGAALPLPPRPEALLDIEKHSWQRISADITDWEEFRNQTKAKGKQEIVWQNTKWWRTLNRCMCVIGTLVIILVIVLAVVGTRNKW